MITKTTTPIILSEGGEQRVTGIRIEYRVFGLWVCRKVLYLPSHYGLETWDYFPYN